MARMRRNVAFSAVATVVVGVLAVTPSDAADDGDIGADDFQVMVNSTNAVREASKRELSAEAQPTFEECVTISGDDELPIFRMAGSDRYVTATCVSVATWPDHDDPEVPAENKAQVVVLARGDNFPDALAGGPLATYHEGPLLLTLPDTLPSVVMDEIQRVLAPGGLIYVLGGGSSVSSDIRSQLESAGYSTVRLAGSNRYETAIEIAKELPNTSNFFFATGKKFPDALAAGNAAASLSLGSKYSEDPEFRPFAVLLTQGDELGDATFDFVLDRGGQFGVWSLVTAGGDADRAAVDAFGTTSLSARFVGSNRFDTAAQISEAIFTDINGELFGYGTGLATGLKFPDALAATASLARWGQPLLLTASDHPTDETLQFLQDHAGEPVDGSLDLFGGTSTISNEVADLAWQAYR